MILITLLTIASICIIILQIVSLETTNINEIEKQIQKTSYRNLVGNKLIIEELNHFLYKDNRLFIVLSSSCVHCKEIFEILWLETKMDFPNTDIILLINKEDSEIINYLKLYSVGFNIMFIEDEFLFDNGIDFQPAFIVCDKLNYIKKSTPNVYEIFSFQKEPDLV
jgi:hypothetical protein